MPSLSYEKRSESCGTFRRKFECDFAAARAGTRAHRAGGTLRGMPFRVRLAAMAAGTVLAAAVCGAEDAATAAKIRRAAELVQTGKPNEAIPIYRELESAFPGVPSFAINVAIAQYKAGRYGDAVKQCREVLRLRPDLFSAWLFLGASQVALGETGAALDPLRKAVALAPEDRNARIMLADALFSTEHYAEAAAQFDEAARRAPDNPRVWQGVARSYDAEAAKLLEEIEHLAPASAEAAALAGSVEAGREQWARALEHYRRALALRADFRTLHAAAAEVYANTGHADWAATEQAKEPEPAAACETRSPECDFAKGLLHEAATAAGKTAPDLYWRARACLELARQARAKLHDLPPSPERWQAAALEHEKKGQYREAAAEWKEAAQLAPDNREFARQLALALCRSNDCASALPVIRKLLDREPASAELNYLYGSALASTESAAQAVAYLEAAVKLDPKLLAARAALGQAYLEAGQPERAVPELEAALTVDEDGSRHYQLARAYQALGKQDQAAATLRAYREILARREAASAAEPRITPH